MRIVREPHDGTQTTAGHDERAEEADAMVTRSVARDEDQRADDDAGDGEEAPEPSTRWSDHHADSAFHERVRRRALHGCPRRRRLRRPRGLERLLAAVPRIEHRDPLAGAVVAEAHLVALPAHAHHDVAPAAPGVEAAVQELELGLARLEGEKAEGDAEPSGCLHVPVGHFLCCQASTMPPPDRPSARGGASSAFFAWWS